MSMSVKKMLSLLLMLVIAVQALIASADVHHALAPATDSQGVHHYEHEHGHENHGSDADIDHANHHHPCCHSHATFTPFLTQPPQGFAGGEAGLSRFPADSQLFSSWISAPDFRPPIL